MPDWLSLNYGKKILNELKSRIDDGELSWRDAIKALTGFLDQGQAQGTPQKIIEAILIDAGLDTHIGKVRTFWRKLSPHTRDFLRPMNEISGIKEWPLFDVSGQLGVFQGILSTPLIFKAATDSSVELEAIQEDLARHMDIVIPDDDVLLRVGLNGKFQVEAGAGMQYGWLGASVSGKSKGEVELDWFFRHHDNEFLIETFAESASHLVSPFEPKKVLEKRSVQLEAIKMKTNGMVSMGGQISAGKTWGSSFVSKGEGLRVNHTIDVGLQAGMTFSSNVNIEGGFQVTVIPSDDQTLEVTLVRSSSKAYSSGLNAGLDIGIEGVDQLGNQIIERWFPDAKDLLDKLDEYINFGTYLKEKSKASLANALNVKDEIETRLIDLLVGDGAVSDLAESLGQALKAEIDDHINTFTGDIKDYSHTVVERVADRMGLDGGLRQDFLQVVTEKLKDEIQDHISALKIKIKEWLEDQSIHVDVLLKPLGDFGVKIDQLSEEADQASQQLLGPVIELIERYQTYRNRLVKAIKGASKLKIGASFNSLFSKKKSREALLVLSVSPGAGAHVEKAYRKMLLGSFGEALEIVQNSEQTGIVIQSGSFKSRFERETMMDYSINLIGLSMNSRLSFKSDVTATFDLNGQVIAAASRTDFVRYFKGIGETRMASFINAFELTGSANVDEAEPLKMFSGGFAISLAEKKMEISELEDFLDGLNKLEFIPEGSIDRGRALIEYHGEKAKSRLQGATVGLSMPFNSDHIKNMARKSYQQILHISVQRQLLVKYNESDRKNIDEFLNGNGPLEDRIIAWRVKNPSAIQAKKYPPGRMAWFIGDRAMKLADMIKNMMTVATLDLVDDEQVVKKLDRSNRHMQKALKDWLKLRGVSEIMVGEKMPSITIAFMATMADLMDINPTLEPFVPVLKWKDETEHLELLF